MRKSTLFATTLWTIMSLGVLCTCSTQTAERSDSSRESSPFTYPAARRVGHVDDYHGTKVADPYRWMEDLDAPELKDWIREENRLTFGYLKKIEGRDQIRGRLEKLWNYDKHGTPWKRGDRWFFSRQLGLQNQPVLYTAASPRDPGRVLLDPNTLSKDGTVALGIRSVSEDGEHIAYGFSKAGSDWVEIKIRNVATGKDLPDHLRWIKFSGASWKADGSGFYYSRFPEPRSGNALSSSNRDQKLYFHQLGTDQGTDRLVFGRPDKPLWRFSARATRDGSYVVISVRESSSKNAVFYRDEDRGGAPIPLLTGWDARYSFLGNEGPVFWFMTDKDAGHGRVIAIDTRTPEPENWRELIPERKETLRNVSVVGERFVASYLKDARSLVNIHHLNGALDRPFALPGLGSASGFGGRRADRESYFRFTSFTVPSAIYRYDFASGKTVLHKGPDVDFRPEDYVTRQVFYRSKDGTRIPMFITHKKTLVRDGKRPVYLYGYGGFNISMTPSFSVSNLVWLEMGGVYAVANLRGGGEYGREWHEAGTRLRKQNVFDDFQAGAEWLIANRYTRPDRLAIGGGSNGGLLVGACMIQRPDLFAAALPAVGVMDMLRFHRFTIGRAWVGDYGCSEDPAQFRALRAYSPYHNLKPGTSYPATLVTTADHDDRVVPAHSFKFTAALQAAQRGPRPTLIRIETDAGHGAGTPTSKRIDAQADKWAFLLRNLNMRLPASWN